MNVGQKISLKIPVAPPVEAEFEGRARSGSGLRIHSAVITPRAEEKARREKNDEAYLDLLAPIVLVLIKSNPRGLKSLASLIRDDPKPEEGDEPPALTAGLVVKGTDDVGVAGRQEAKLGELCRTDDSGEQEHREARGHLIQQFSVALKQFFTACTALVAIPWHTTLWRDDLRGTEILRSFSSRRGAAWLCGLMSVLCDYEDVLGYGSTVIFMITMLLTPPSPEPTPRDAVVFSRAFSPPNRPDWAADCLADLVKCGALEVLLAVVVNVDCIAVQVTSLSTIGMLLRLSPPLLRRFFEPCCAVENDEESGPVSGLSIVLGVIRGSRDKYALQAAAADVLRAAVEAGGSRCAIKVARAPAAYGRKKGPESALPTSASRGQYVVRRLVRSRAWNGTRVLVKALRRLNKLAGVVTSPIPSTRVEDRPPSRDLSPPALPSRGTGSGTSPRRLLPRLEPLPSPFPLDPPSAVPTPAGLSAQAQLSGVGRALQGTVSLSGRQRRQMLQAHASVFNALLAIVVHCPSARPVMATQPVMEVLDLACEATGHDAQLQAQAREAKSLLQLAQTATQTAAQTATTDAMATTGRGRAKTVPSLKRPVAPQSRICSARLISPCEVLSSDSEEEPAAPTTRRASIHSPRLTNRRVSGGSGTSKRFLGASEPLTARGAGGSRRSSVAEEAVVSGGHHLTAVIERTVRAWTQRPEERSRRRVRSANVNDLERSSASLAHATRLRRSRSAHNLVGQTKTADR